MHSETPAKGLAPLTLRMGFPTSINTLLEGSSQMLPDPVKMTVLTVPKFFPKDSMLGPRDLFCILVESLHPQQRWEGGEESCSQLILTPPSPPSVAEWSSSSPMTLALHLFPTYRKLAVVLLFAVGLDACEYHQQARQTSFANRWVHISAPPSCGWGM